MPAAGDDDGGTLTLRHATRVGAYVARELANDAGLLVFELGAGLAGVVGLGLYEGALVFKQGVGGGPVVPPQPLRYALWTTLPSVAGRPLPSDAVLRSLLNLPPLSAANASTRSASHEAALAGTTALKVRNIQAGRHVVALATIVGVTLQIGASIQRGRQHYQAQVQEGREPPLAPPQAVRISHRPPACTGTAPAFHVGIASGTHDRVPWWAGEGGVLGTVPQRWWTRAEWIQDPREWAQLLPSPTVASFHYSKTAPLFLEAEVAASERPRGLSLELALESLRAGGRASSSSVKGGMEGVVRILLAGGEVLRGPIRRGVEESGAVDLLVDGEAAVAVAVLAWMEKTPYASAWSALAAQRTREEEAKISARREGNAFLWKGYESVNAWVERVPVSSSVERPWRWLAHTWESVGRRLRWLIKGGVTARDALEEYKVVVLVHDADSARLGQRMKMKELLQGAGWDVWGPGTSASRLVRDKDALVPVLVFCQDDATTLERARFLVRAGRPPQLTCALLEDPESASPWLGEGGREGGGGDDRPTVLSMADVHDSLFAFVRGRVKEGRGLGEIQRELDASTRLCPTSSSSAPSIYR